MISRPVLRSPARNRLLPPPHCIKQAEKGEEPEQALEDLETIDKRRAALAEQGKHEEALFEMQAALETRLAALGESHKDVAFIRHTLGCCLLYTSDAADE